MKTEKFSLNIDALEYYAKNHGGFVALVETLWEQEKILNDIKAGNLTLPQIKKLSQKMNVPFGFMFFKKPPNDYNIPMPDLRRRSNKEVLSDDFIQLCKDVIFRQEWYKSTLIAENASKLQFVGLFNQQSNVFDIVNDMKNRLKIRHPKTKKDVNDYYKTIVKSAEDIGILVMETSYVGNNKKRTLNDSEFLGFAFVDDIVPLVFINKADKSKAKIFTLLHELAHIWVGQSGISGNYNDFHNKKIEMFCNDIAGELLIPKDAFLKEWNEKYGIDNEISRLSDLYKVSGVVVACIAWKSGKISYEKFNEIRQKSKQKTDGKFALSFKAQRTIKAKINSERLTRFVFSRLAERRITYRDAGNVLGIPINKVEKYVHH